MADRRLPSEDELKTYMTKRKNWGRWGDQGSRGAVNLITPEKVILITTPGGKKLYLAGDTGLFGDMSLIGEEGIDLAVIPIGDNYTMGPDDALRAVKLLKAKHVIPVHHSTWELIEQDADAWAERVRSETETEPHVLKPGESFTL